MWYGRETFADGQVILTGKLHGSKLSFRANFEKVTTKNILLETQSFVFQRVISGANLFLKRRDDATSVRVKKLAISWAGYEITKASNGPTESSRLAPDITELRGQFDWNDAKSHCLAHDMDLCAPESL